MWKRIENEGAPLLVFLSVVVILLIAAVAAYFLLSSKRTRKPTRRVASWAAAAVSTVVALFATMHFGIPVLEDFKNPDVAVRDTLIGTAIVWAICIFAWLIAARCIVVAVRGDSQDENQM